MQRLKLYILLFGAALMIPLGYFVLRTHRSIEQEELAELRFFAEALFEEMETELTVLIHTEEARSIEEYTFTYVSLADPGDPLSEHLAQSPLNELPGQDYILGYMQNNPDGSFQTPLTEGMVILSPELAEVVASLEWINTIFNDKRSTTPEEALSEYEEMAELALEEQARQNMEQADPSVADRYLERADQELKTHLGQEDERVEELSEEEYNRALQNMQQMQRMAENEVPGGDDFQEFAQLETPEQSPDEAAPTGPELAYSLEQGQAGGGGGQYRERATTGSDVAEDGSVLAPALEDDPVVRSEVASEEQTEGYAGESPVVDSLENSSDMAMLDMRDQETEVLGQVESSSEPALAPLAEPEPMPAPMPDNDPLPGAASDPIEGAEPANGIIETDLLEPSRESFSGVGESMAVIVPEDADPNKDDDESGSGQSLAMEQAEELAESLAPAPVVTQDEYRRSEPAQDWESSPDHGDFGSSVPEESYMDDSLADQSLLDGAPPSPETPVESDAVDLDGSTASMEPETFQVEVAPMQSVLIDQDHIFIFRRIVIANQIYRQGFVLRVNEFLAHLADNHFADQPMAEFSGLRLAVMDNGQETSAVTSGVAAQGSDFQLERVFPRPFSFLKATLTCDAIPGSQARSTLVTMTTVLAMVILVGLFAIYQSSRVVLDMSHRRQGFVSSVTHELKTPLTNIRMYVEMLEHGMARDTEREQEYLRIVGSESGRLSRLINNVLEFSKLENRSRRLDMVQGDLSEVLREVEEVMREKARQEGFTLTVQREDIPPVLYNPEALTQVLINLVENSLKFGKQSPEKAITLRVLSRDSHVLVEVSDTGPGIPPHALRKVFDDFYRVESPLTPTTRGTGIGLALVRKLVAAMSGQVEASNNSGPGCTITITLPV
ncbi:MAG: sensor histidine kinase [Desulfovibrio sp.]|nr:MAG: sensor histidine kinase [Desulfovibrio sp.]